MRLREEGTSLILDVLDDGVGPGAAVAAPNELMRAHHFGVAQMHQWAELAGDRLEIAPRESRGTGVRLVMPGG